MRCVGKYKDGRRCQSPGIIDGKYCRRHRPKTTQFTNRASCSVSPTQEFANSLHKMVVYLVRQEIRQVLKEIV